MIELKFRAMDRNRPAKSYVVHLVLALVVLVVEGFAAFVKLGAVGFSWLTGGSIALLAPLLLLSSRSWSRVGADGITICWGLGHGRTYPWHEIRWIDVRETKGQGSSSYAVRIFLEGGRRRSLPGLYRSDMHPAPDFDEQFQRVVNWWELSTDQTARVRPPKQFRDRLTPTVIGLVVVPVAFVVVAVVALVILAPH
ncbi:hypothetical protein BLA24_24095 [Streptomyces cinnamoneus]|uniref:PH domain-containing protein n=1 Tax=Streptomyces cinnamoneus TaxID=53446 RepID=A0A2G1XD34_STRCJ|nr:hypothetical protein [Streptomyces cinnamoneus]PHQ49153.1 hypothetical protein BLA24_24095 [Streptomyces cinnamoneus]